MTRTGQGVPQDAKHRLLHVYCMWGTMRKPFITYITNQDNINYKLSNTSYYHCNNSFTYVNEKIKQ